MSDLKPILDLDKIVAARSKGKKIPKFAVSLMKKIIHQDFLNDIYVTSGGSMGTEFCDHVINYLDVKLEVSGMENLAALPEGARCTFVSNHPLGGIDGVSLGKIVGGHFGGHIRYLVNDLLMNVPGLAPICVPINKLGGQARNLPALINEAFESEDHMIMFPAGLCSRKIDGVIQDIPWGKAFITKSVATGRHIVPVHFIGQNSRRFYNIAALCKKLKLKFNLAMLFLPDEMYRARHSTFKVVVGQPLPPQSFDSSKTPVEWAQWVREQVYKL